MEGVMPSTHPGTVAGYASVFNVVDYQNDSILPGAFAVSLASSRPARLLWQHDPSLPIGRIVALSEDETGLRMTAVLALDSIHGQDAYALLKAGALDGLSIGFRPVHTHPARDKGVRLIRTAELWEVSLVTFAANPKARVLGVN
jgi:HK97 family phage prohead protease